MDPVNQLDPNALLGLLGLAVIVIVIVTVMFLLKKQVHPYPYEMREALFTPAERNFLKVLDQAVGTRLRVFGKVRVADVVKVESMGDRARWQRAFNKISGKHFDYILCAPYDLSVVCAVELDDASHGQRKRIERDTFLEGVCNAAGLPLVRVPASRKYDAQEIQSAILDALNWQR